MSAWAIRLPQEVKVTKSDHIYAIVFSELSTTTESESGVSGRDWHTMSLYDIHLPRLLWECTVLDSMYASVKGSDRTDKLEGKASIANCGLHPGKFKVLRNLKHYLGAQSQGHHTPDQLEERAVERGST